ncbi:MAG: M23 family metallopeptidase [Clostridia bacterium]|nr:M23 family metallopeptidase [Clostridia bacterium]
MKKIVYLCMIALSAGLVAFVITLAKYDYDIDERKEIVPIRIDSEKEYVRAESSIRINPEALERETKKVATKVEILKTETESVNKSKEDEKVREVVATPKKEITFTKPCEGEIIKSFSGEDLVYSKTLKEWIIHNGIDISGKKGEIINSVCDGEIANIKYDYKYGNVIEMKSGEFFIKYAGVEPLDGLKIGDKVKVGQQIAMMSDDVGFELDAGVHLHLEIIKNNKQINPSTLISNL